MQNSKDIGNIFGEARRKLGLSVEDVYRRSRIHPNVLKDIENGVFDKIGKLYMKSFLRKYSDFLGLDTPGIMDKYEAVSRDLPDRQYGVPAEKEAPQKKEAPVKKVRGKTAPFQGDLFGRFAGKAEAMKQKKPGSLPAKDKKKENTSFQSYWKNAGAGTRLVLAVIFVCVPVMLVLLARPKTVHKAPPKTAVTAKVTAAKKAKAVNYFPKEEKGEVSLILEARDDVWVQVDDGEKRVFVGILKKGGVKKLASDGTLSVWTGNGDNLKFTVNGHKMGVVAAGVVKNIEVSREGVKVGNDWVSRFE
ncbi:MAG: helix-turn-helix domain-containing protein [Candidatus Omnitrophota bacterium]